MRAARSTAGLVVAVVLCACAGGGQATPMMPTSGGSGGVGSTIVRILVPANPFQNGGVRNPIVLPGGPNGGATPMPIFGTPGPGPVPTGPPPAGSQQLAINVSGPVTISQTVSVGPGSGGCSPSTGGTTCQLALSLPAGTYAGTIGANGATTAVAFSVTAAAQNVFGMTLGGVPAQITLVPGSFLGGANAAQGGIDLYGAGRHPVLVELLDANQNVIVGGGAGTFTLTQTGGNLPLAVSQPSTIASNLFYVTPPSTGSTNAASLRASANYFGGSNLCLQPSAVCAGTVRVDLRQVLGVANSNVNTIALYVNGQNLPIGTVNNGVFDPQALIFDSMGDLFVANQPGSVSEFAPPYNTQPTAIANGVDHPQALAIDARGDLFVANGSGSNTVTMYSPPYGAPTATIANGVNDPVSIALDGANDLFVVNSTANTVTAYAPPYKGAPITISKGLNTPNSLALDGHGNLFVANLTSTPNSVVEYSAPFTNDSAPVATITSGINELGSIGLNGSANLFVPNEGANTVTEYVAPYTGAPATITGGQSQPVALAIDAFGTLYVANYGNNTITQYSPPYAGGSWTTIATGVSLPVALALSPPTSGAAAL